MNISKRLVTMCVGVVLLGALAGITGCGGGGSSSSPDITSGLIHWWKLDGNALDSVGTLNGTVQGPVSYAPAVIGDGMVGNGETTGITLPASADMQFQNSFTISAWAETSTAAQPDHIWETIFFDGDDRTGLDPYFLSVDSNGELTFQVCGAANAYTVSTPMPMNKFVLLTGTYDSSLGELTLYINGALVGQTAAPQGTPVVTLDPNSLPGMGIGCNNQFPDSNFNFSWNGSIDDVRVYNRALNASQVQALYHSGI